MTGARRGRFIAGAVCPQCGVMDRLLVEPVEATSESGAEAVATRRRCVSCGYSDEQRAGSSQAPRTRLDGALKGPDSEASGVVTPVRFIDPDGG